MCEKFSFLWSWRTERGELKRGASTTTNQRNGGWYGWVPGAKACSRIMARTEKTLRSTSGPARKLETPSQDHLRECFDYDPISGSLRWNKRPDAHFRETGGKTARHQAAIWNGRWAGKIAGSPDAEGYLTVCVDAVRYKVHRIIWKMMTGREPDEIDHQNMKVADNRWNNLRDCNHSENGRNRLGIGPLKGVRPIRGKFRARIKINYKSIHLGLFDTPEDAHLAYQKASERLHGEFARHS